MDILYTDEEMSKSYVIEGASTSKKEPLDLERLHKIRGNFFSTIFINNCSFFKINFHLDAVFIKYRVPNHKKNEFYEIVKARACRKCLDTAKEFKKKNAN